MTLVPARPRADADKDARGAGAGSATVGGRDGPVRLSSA